MKMSLKNDIQKLAETPVSSIKSDLKLCDLRKIIESEELLEIGRKAIEDVLVDYRDSRIFLPFRNNGLVIKERDGRYSDVIRMGPEGALRIGLKAIADYLDQHE
jgi:hypothetical protein